MTAQICSDISMSTTDAISQLRISNVAAQHGGVYELRVENAFGCAAYRCELIVSGGTDDQGDFLRLRQMQISTRSNFQTR